jgi:antidote-toxin recognition MazE-like antitoxin
MSETRKRAKPRPKSKPLSGAERAKRYREKMRASGLKPVQMWVWDTSRPGFAEECRRQSRLVKEHPQEKEIVQWLDAVRDVKGWT